MSHKISWEKMTVIVANLAPRKKRFGVSEGDGHSCW